MIYFSATHNKYDVVFWAYIDSVLDRFIPLMISLNKKGYKTILFYKDYDMLDNNSLAQELLIRKYNLKVITYSDFLKNDYFLKIITVLIKFSRINFIKNKLRGLRIRFLKKAINKDLIKNILLSLGHNLNVFDIIKLKEYTEYPYGSFYIKHLSDALGIKSIAIPHGIAAHYTNHRKEEKIIDFDKIILCNEKEKVYSQNHCTDRVSEIIPIGDPRFDSTWKPEVKTIFINEALKRVRNDSSKKILYISPGLEHFNLTDEKYKALNDVAKIISSLGNVRLFIKPHPRHRHHERIQEIMRNNKVKKFEILPNDPLIAYADFMDYIISPVSSAIFDLIPESVDKVIIYDNFSKKEGLLNIFDGHLNFFDDSDSLKLFLSQQRPFKKHNIDEITKFCDKWAANSQGLDTIIARYVSFIIKEMRKS